MFSLALIGCAHGNVIRDARVGDADTKIVGLVWPSPITVPLNAETWRASPWWRESDMVTPSRVVISEGKLYACIMRDGDVSQPEPGHTFTCAEPWRAARNRGR